MTEPKERSRPANRLAGIVLASTGFVIISALAGFITIAIGFRQSFTSTMPPFEDLVQGFAMLTPLVLLGLILIGYGRSLLRK